MKKSRFENGPLNSLMNDGKVVEELLGQKEKLTDWISEAEGLAGMKAIPLLEGMDSHTETMERILEGREGSESGFGLPEAIILLSGRPALLIQHGRWEEPRLAEIKKRLEAASDHLLKTIPKVARLELLNHPDYDYVGTAWMIDEDVMLTNRHVANMFSYRSNGGIVTKTTPFGDPYRAQVDFIEEYDSSEYFEVPIEEVLFIEKDGSNLPDMALVRIAKVDGLPEPIELSDQFVSRDEDVAVIGYPASDGSRNDPFVMHNIFKGIYEVKRLSPGRVSGVRPDRFLLTHDCTTLGGNSGSVVLSLSTGKAVGLHFSGRYRNNNFAVTSETLREKLASLSHRVTVPIFVEERVGPADNLKDRTGYDSSFLSKDVPLPMATSAIADKIAPVRDRDDGLLHYTHFSVVMHQDRRMAVYTACNIDGGRLYNIRRGRDDWDFDGRLENQYQAGPDLYYKNPLDRGHLVRRLDPAWGNDREEAAKGVEDTFFYTNCSPQHSKLNQRSWLRLEDYILDNAATHDLKVSVFTGPVFNRYDREYRGFLIPQEYWKVVVVVNAFSGELSATGYLLSQADLVNNLEFVFGEFKTYQVPIRVIEGKTGLSFGDLLTYDPFGTVESFGFGVIEGPGDLVL